MKLIHHIIALFVVLMLMLLDGFRVWVLKDFVLNVDGEVLLGRKMKTADEEGVKK